MKILIIQQKMIGDVLVSTILCEHIKKNISDAQVHYLINDHTEAVVHNNPYIDKIVFFRPHYRTDKLMFFSFLKGIRREKYDVVIDAYGKLESNLISLFSGAPITISYSKGLSKFIYSHVVPYPKNRDTRLGGSIDKRLKLLSPILSDPIDLTIAPKIYLAKEEIRKAASFLETNGITFSQSIVMFNVLGSSAQKTYPLPYMAKIIDAVAQNTNAVLLFNYIPSQQTIAKELLAKCAGETQKRIRFDVFPTNLRAFLALLHHCNMLVGNEGGAVNMAKAIGLPTFAIFSPFITKAAWNTFRDDGHVAVHLNDYLPEKIRQKSRKKLKKESQALYRSFKPSFFMDTLAHFIDEYT